MKPHPHPDATRPRRDRAVASRSAWRRAGWLAVGVAGVLAGVVVVSDLMGWPYLAGPVQRGVARSLERAVSFSDQGQPSLRLHLLFGGPRVVAGRIDVGPPSSSAAPVAPLEQFSASALVLRARWGDLYDGWRGRGWRLDSVEAGTLALEVRPGRAGTRADSGAPTSTPHWSVGRLAVGDGRLRVFDAARDIDLDVSFRGRLGVAADRQGAAGDPPDGLRAEVEGRYGEAPVRGDARVESPQGGLGSDAAAWPASLRFEAGRVRLTAQGRLVPRGDAWRVDGRYQLAGPSLAAVGDPVGVTLPATPPFTLDGTLNVESGRWHTEVTQARIGESRLAGVFDYRSGPTRPRLDGRLTGNRLVLADLAPAIGAGGPTTRDGTRVLPNRPFDLPSLRAMDARVQIALDSFDAGTDRLRDVRPLNARLTLVDGVLTIDQLDARVADGRISGLVQLDGRETPAHLSTDLQLRAIALERWIVQARAGKAPPYIAGRLGASVQLKGEGRSTAELLGSADGRVALWLRDGRLSHLALEAMGLDVAQALGVAVRGDEALPVRCGAADFGVRNGVVRPSVAVLDTRDSTVMMTGSVSLASETMALRVQVAPKDVTPLALRSPVHVDGPLADPSVSIEAVPLLKRLLPAAVLAAVNPLAALLPLIDLGDEDARAAASRCRTALQRRDPRARSAG